MMKPCMLMRFTSMARMKIRSESASSGRAAWLYCEMRPHSGMRACVFSSGTTAVKILPPTLSKYTSMPFGQAADSSSLKFGARWSMQASKPSASTAHAHFSAPPAMPTARQPLSFAICPTTEPTAPVAAATTTVSPRRGLPISSKPMKAVNPGIPRTPSAREPLQTLCAADREFLPTARRHHQLARLKLGVARLDDAANAAAGHDLSDCDRRGIRGSIVHAYAHVRIERQPERAHEHPS